MAKKKIVDVKPDFEMYDYFEVTFNFTGRLCGSVPLSKDLVPAWLEARKPKTKPEDARPMDDLVDEVNKSIEIQQEGLDEEEIQKIIEKTTLGFQADSEGFLVVRMGTIKAHLKDCANQIKEALGLTALKAKVANFVYLVDYFNHILKDGKKIQESDNTYEQPVHAFVRSKGAVEKINALKVIHYVVNPTIKFRLMVMKNDKMSIGILIKILEYGGIHGYGGERSLGEGRYTASIKKAQRFEDAPVGVTIENDVFSDVSKAA